MLEKKKVEGEGEDEDEYEEEKNIMLSEFFRFCCYGFYPFYLLGYIYF